jgi:hypothetical protein
MVHYVCEGVDKNAQAAALRRVVSSFLARNPSVGFAREMIPLLMYLLAYCSESTAFYILSTIYSAVVPKHLYPVQYKL